MDQEMDIEQMLEDPSSARAGSSTIPPTAVGQPAMA